MLDVDEEVDAAAAIADEEDEVLPLPDVYVNALVLPPDTMTEQAYADQFKTGTMVRSRTRVLTIAGGDLERMPAEGDMAVFEGFEWTFVGVKITAPDGTPILVQGTVKR